MLSFWCTCSVSQLARALMRVHPRARMLHARLPPPTGSPVCQVPHAMLQFSQRTCNFAPLAFQSPFIFAHIQHALAFCWLVGLRISSSIVFARRCALSCTALCSHVLLPQVSPHVSPIAALTSEPPASFPPSPYSHIACQATTPTSHSASFSLCQRASYSARLPPIRIPNPHLPH